MFRGEETHLGLNLNFGPVRKQHSDRLDASCGLRTSARDGYPAS